MPDEEKKDGGRVVYHRIGEAEEGGRVRPGAGSKGEGEKNSAGASVGRRSLWQAIVPLFVGFVLLVGLVIGLGVLSDRELEDISKETSGDERRLSTMFRNLLDLQLALNKLHTEARIRAQVESGTKGVLQLPTDIRLRREREEVQGLLQIYDNIQLADAEKKLEVRRRIVEYVEDTKDLETYSLKGFAHFRDLENQLKSLFSEITQERDRLDQRRLEALRSARGKIRFLMWLAALTGLVVATATFLEVLRRFRQMRRSFEALRRERQFSAQMLEGMVSAIAAVGPDDRIRSANAAFFAVFPRATVGVSVHDDFTTPEGMKLLASAAGRRTGTSAYHGRWRLPGGGGVEAKERAFDVYSSPLEIEGGAGQLLTLVDVTEAAESEQELRRQESLAAVGHAAAQLAHEIKNPLGSIRLGVAMLRDMARDRESVTTIDLVERGIEHLSKLTLDVTQFSRLKMLTTVESSAPTPRPESRPRRRQASGAADARRDALAHEPVQAVGRTTSYEGLSQLLANAVLRCEPRRLARHHRDRAYGSARRHASPRRGRAQGSRRPHPHRRPRRGDGRTDARAHLRALLYHQEARHGPRPRHRQADRRAARRRNPRRERTGRGHELHRRTAPRGGQHLKMQRPLKRFR